MQDSPTSTLVERRNDKKRDGSESIWVARDRRTHKKLTGRPESTSVRVSGELGRVFNNASSKAELVPSLQHGRLNVFLIRIVRFLLFVECLVGVFLLSCCDVEDAACSLCVLGTVVVQCIVGVCVA